MGIPKEEMSVRFDEIAAFAEIGDFIDQPVRIYSSGIYVRLAFAVAVNVDSEILVVDEALAVGDAGFRSRCFRRIGELREAGCTILFVSHAMDQIVSLCQQAILIDEGEILFIGRPESAVEQYQSLTSAAASDRQSLRKQLLEPHASAAAPLLDVTDPAAQIVKDEILERFSTELCSDSTLPYDPNGALIEAVRILTLTGDRVNQLISGRTYRCTFRVVLTREAVNVRIAMLIKTNADMDLGGAYSAPSSAEAIPFIRSGSVIDVEFEFKCILNTGIFFINVAVFGSVAGVEFALYGIINAERFRVVALPNCAALAIVDFDCRATLRMNSSEGT
jgi:lipopolysaccharide transport system ATP-binding protein